MIKNSEELSLTLNELKDKLYINNSTYNNLLSDLEEYINNLNLFDITDNLNKSDIKILLDIAKDVYYNTGDLLITDNVYDELESYIGLENKNYVGSKSSSKHANYTVKHSFIMGSLSKVQIKKDKEGKINWNQYTSEIMKYLNKANNYSFIQTTPKLDGASFSAEFCYDKETKKANLISCATRGDGTYGTDISHWFIPHYKKYWKSIDNACRNILKTDNNILCIRGEVLVPLSIFSEKYSDMFVNPRSFVAGSLGLKKDDISEELLNNNDLHFVCYDYRIYNKVTGIYKELGWFSSNDPTYNILKPYLGEIGELPDKKYCCEWLNNGFHFDLLKTIYEYYDDFRKNKSEYALDGIVFKPDVESRQYNMDRVRPVDCVAMKFIPMVSSTEIIDIEWNVKKTGEYFPKAIIKPIYLDGKEITKASLHNYNYIIKNKCGINSKVNVDLAGDIIPYISEVTYAAGIDNINLPNDTEIVTDEKSGTMHLMKIFKDSIEVNRNKFISSSTALNINTIGSSISGMLYNSLYDKVDYTLDNIIYLMSDDNINLIKNTLGESKTTNNIITNLINYRNNLTLEDIILSFCFKSCGNRASKLCAKILRNEEYNISGFSSVAYSWSLDKESVNYKKVMNVIDILNIPYVLESNNDINETINNVNKIPIIMTGSPKEFGYSNKKEFLNNHSEYIETTVWNECKILFTDDLNSSSSKMKKANKLGIEIKLYY